MLEEGHVLIIQKRASTYRNENESKTNKRTGHWNGWIRCENLAVKVCESMFEYCYIIIRINLHTFSGIITFFIIQKLKHKTLS